MPDQHPTLTEYDDRDQPVVAEPEPDPRLVALQEVITAEANLRTCVWRLEDAQRNERSAQDRLVNAQAAYDEAMAAARQQ